MSFLEASQVSKRFGGNQALDQVGLVADPGEVVGLIGPNGSGKTTLLNVLSGVLRPDRGEVRVADRVATRLPPQRRSRLGLGRTFQQEMSFPALTVADNLRIAFEQHRRGRVGAREVADLIDYVGLPAASASQPAGDLSWGQGRMLGIALGMATGPKVLLLDEPFAGLQRMAALKIVDLLRRLQTDGLGLVIVEHEMSLLLPLCDRVVVLAAGQQIASGTPDEVLEDRAVIDAYFGTVV